MELKKVLEVIEIIKKKLENQKNIQDERLLNHLANLNQLAIELIMEDKKQ